MFERGAADSKYGNFEKRVQRDPKAAASFDFISNISIPSETRMNPSASNFHTSVEDLESECIQFFVGLARFFGFPRSVGEIFGLLFVSERPLAFDEISRRRRISAGSVSAGVRYLRRAGAIVALPVAGERRDYFAINTEFKKMTAGVFRQYLEPRIVADTAKIAQLRRLADRLSDGTRRKCVVDRLNQLERWHLKMRTFVSPLLSFT
jgi:DNA-binding transcriptional regulator GbsR (MarR family)